MVVYNPNVRTSRVGPTVKALYLAIRDEADLPVGPGNEPVPTFLGWEPTDVAEFVAVVVAPDESATEWIRMGAAGRDETFVVEAMVRTGMASESDQVAAWDRLTEVVAGVEAIAYNTETGKPRSFDVANVTRRTRVAGVEQRLERHGDGYVGIGMIRFAFVGRV